MRRFFALCLLILSFNVSAAPVIETIQVNHRPAQAVLTDISAFLSDTATIRAYQNLLIIKAEPSEIETIKQLLKSLDAAPQKITISLIKTSTRLDQQHHNQIQTEIDISPSDSNANIAVKSWHTNRDSQRDTEYEVRGLAGHSVNINLGQLVPLEQQSVLLRFNGDVMIQNTLEYIPVNSGFSAIANILANGKVIVEIHSQSGQYNQRNKNIDSQNLITRVSGMQNQWIQLAQVNETGNVNRESSGHYQTNSQENNYFYIKVNPLN